MRSDRLNRILVLGVSFVLGFVFVSCRADRKSETVDIPVTVPADTVSNAIQEQTADAVADLPDVSDADTPAVASSPRVVPVQKENAPEHAIQWLSKVKEVADWYCKTFENYQQFLGGKMCPVVDKKVRDDCSGLATACLQNYGIYHGNTIYNSAAFRDKNSELGHNLQKFFDPIEGEFMQTEYEKFQPGDILAGFMFENGKVQRAHGHVTIYAGNGQFYDWGGWAYKADSQPVAGEESAGYMHDHLYTIIWRIK